MRSSLRLLLALSGLLAACASKRSGLDSESHFACDSDADCAIHDTRLTCVAHQCVIIDASVVDATSAGGRGATGTGGRPATGGGDTATGGIDAGAGGRVVMGAGGNSPSGTGGKTSVVTPDAAPDAGLTSCHSCVDSLSAEGSLDCYCKTHDCDSYIARALNNPIWDTVATGCGQLAVWSAVRAAGASGEMEAFDPGSGALIGAARWSRPYRGECVTPAGQVDSHGVWVPDIYAAGGRGFYLSNDSSCQDLKLCSLTDNGDGGLLSLPRRCDIDAILTSVGVDAGTCPEGLVRASVCTVCSSNSTGCDRRNLDCAAPCTTNEDCRTEGTSDTCFDSVCQDVCAP